MKYDKIVAINKEKSKEKTEIAINEIEKMYQRKERISEVRKALDEALLQQGECYNPKKVIFDRALEETNNNLKTAVMRLKKQVAELEKEKSRLEKKVEELTRELEKQKK